MGKFLIWESGKGSFSISLIKSWVPAATGHLNRKDDLGEMFHYVCTLDLLKCYLSGSHVSF